MPISGVKPMRLQQSIQLAAHYLQQADGLIIAAGAGMGVDSGLPTFRGAQGFWNEYPALGQRKMGFYEIARPSSFDFYPELVWGFYGHRLDLYRNTRPHAGFSLLKYWARSMPHGAWVYTSNIDGQFQKAGFDANRLCEIHGSIHQLQCVRACRPHYWPADDVRVSLDLASGCWQGPMPRCPTCGQLARPLVLMFDDYEWLSLRSELQQHNAMQWLKRVKRPVIIEIGAGKTITSLRRIVEKMPYPLIRINPDHPQLPAGRTGVALAMGALDALQAMHGFL
jgi:NAD-dependent SIR2 family protein deacetylase